MSALFKARVVKLDDATAQIRLYIVHPDQTRFYTSKNFILQLLWSALRVAKAKRNKKRPLAQAISAEEILNRDYVLEHQDDFIETVECLELENYPRTIDFEAMSDKEFDQYWENEAGLPQALMEVTVTDPKWIAHLTPGMEWNTTAYDMS